jgi:PAS domain S-box-containing protein
MRLLRDVSIRAKLTILVILTSSVALLVACTVFVLWDRLESKRSMVQDLTTLAGVIGSNSTAALVFESAEDARETLAALRAEPHVMAACIYMGDGLHFAHYLRDSDNSTCLPDGPEHEHHRFESDALVLFRDIKLEGRTIGTLYLKADLQEMHGRLRQYARIVAVVVAVSLLFALVITARLHRIISGPIRHLADVAKHVSVNREYEVRASKSSRDEVGFLVDQFNEMLAQIHERDLALQKSREVLEERVRERTRDLENDIAGRNWAEQKLRASEKRFLDVALSSADWIWEVDRDGKYTYASGRVKQLLGYEPEEIIGKSPFDLMPADEADRIGKIFTALAAVKAPIQELENWNLTKDGRRVCLLTSGVPMLDETGTLLGYRGLDKDITDRKRAQERQRKLQQQLEHARRMESLGVLAGGVAHDLNNMLGPLVAYPDLILRKLAADSPVRKEVGRMGKAAEAAADVIQDLLTLARRGRYELKPTNLNEVIQIYLDSPACAHLKQEQPEVRLRVSIDHALGDISGSASHLTKMVMNLVVNAYDAMPDGGELMIATGQQHTEKLLSGYTLPEPGDHVVLRVRDTGVGIDPEDLAKIFEPYYSNKKMGRSGTGLGLAVVYGIVKDHKGYYDIISAIGAGTEFVLYFPVTEDTVITERRKTDARIHGHETVLVVDDAQEQRELATELLASLGYRVETAVHGTAAVEHLRTHRADVLLLDMIMEDGFDGLDTYREILKLHPGQKAVIVSGFSATDRVNEMQRLGAGRYVKKPYTRETIGLALRAELDAA